MDSTGSKWAKVRASCEVGEGLRRCRRCSEAKSLEDFEKASNCVDGRTLTCRACRAAKRAALPPNRIQRTERACSGCGRTLALTPEFWHRNARMADGFQHICRDCMSRKQHDLYARGPERNERQKGRRREYRLATLIHYGGNPPRCACCGESAYEFLVLDHINGGGSAHRREIGEGFQLHEWLRRNGLPEGFRVLCQNCNMSVARGAPCAHVDPEWEPSFTPHTQSYWNATQRKKDRGAVFLHYGGTHPKCECCGEDRRRFLCIDHIIGGRGVVKADRPDLPRGGNLYWRIFKAGFPEGLRLLCHNCNSARGNYGYCPHERQHP